MNLAEMHNDTYVLSLRLLGICALCTTSILASQQPDLLVTDKVDVDLYAEALCPFCARFTQTTLAPLFSNGLSDIIELEVVMYGNAHNNSEVSNMHSRLQGLSSCSLVHFPSTVIKSLQSHS